MRNTGKGRSVVLEESQDVDKLAQFWVNGEEIDWKAYYGEYQPKKVSLPTYPFAKERYWVQSKPSPWERLFKKWGWSKKS